MAALLRQAAARRLGGSMLQRAEAAVAQGRRRLVHTDEKAGVEGLDKMLKPGKVQGAEAATTAKKKKRYNLTDQGSAFVIVFGFVVCPLVLRAMTKGKGDASKEWVTPI